jgi:hypothetical protein
MQSIDSSGTIAAIAAVVAGVEILLHAHAISDAIGFDDHWSTYKYDRVLHHRHVPNSRGLVVDRMGYDGYRAVVRYNSYGIREDKEIDVPKPPGCYRVLLLGDSMIEGAAVSLQMTLGKRLEHRLAAASTKFRFEVLNCGVSGWSTCLEYIYYKNEGVILDPDLVILCFCLNDVSEDYHYLKAMKTDETDLPIAVSPDGIYIHNRLILGAATFRRRMKLYALLKDFLLRPLDRSRALRRGGRFGLKRSLQFTRRDRVATSTLAIFKEKYSSQDEMVWNRTKRYILAIKEIADHNKQHMILVCIPFPHQVSHIQHQLGKQTWGTELKDYVEESKKPQEVLRDFAMNNKMHFVDLLPPFKDVGRTEELFFSYDGHFNERGHELAAVTLTEYIIKHILKWKPPPSFKKTDVGTPEVRAHVSPESPRTTTDPAGVKARRISQSSQTTKARFKSHCLVWRY